jgi:hypothetical protein
MQLQGIEPSDPFVKKVLDAYTNEVYGPLLREAREMGIPGYAQFDPKLQMQRAMQMIRRDNALGQTEVLRAIVRENAIEQLMNNPKLRQNKKFAKALGLDLDMVELLKARRMGRVTDPNEMAEIITNKIMDGFLQQYAGRGILSVMELMKGEEFAPFIFIDPFKQWSNGARFLDFLETNEELVARNFVRKVGPDIEMYRTFGATNPKKQIARDLPIWESLREEQLAALEEAKKIVDPKKRAAEVRNINAEIASFSRDFDIMVDRIKHIRGLPDDPSNIGFRLGRFFLNLNVVRLMGGVVISSMADVARPVLKYGMMHTFRQGLVPLFRDLAQIQLSAREGARAGAITEVLLHGRSQSLTDIFDDLGEGNRFERGLQAATNKIGLVALFDYWTDSMKSFSSSIIMGKLLEDMTAEIAGEASPTQSAFLRHLNLTPENVKEIMELNELTGTQVKSGIKIPNTELWDKLADGSDAYDFDSFSYRADVPSTEIAQTQRGAEMQRIFRAALARSINDTIITPGVERPAWIDASTAGRIIGQFRSFSFSSNISTVTALRQAGLVEGAEAAPRIMTGMTLSLALGALSYYLAGIATGGPYGERARKLFEDAGNGDTEALGKIADEAIARSGLLGMFEDLRRTAERIPGLQDVVTFGNSPTSRSPFVSPITDILGPSIGLLGEADAFARTVDEPNRATVQAVRAVLPYQNVFYVRRLLTQISEGMMKQMGID